MYLGPMRSAPMIPPRTRLTVFIFVTAVVTALAATEAGAAPAHRSALPENPAIADLHHLIFADIAQRVGSPGFPAFLARLMPARDRGPEANAVANRTAPTRTSATSAATARGTRGRG